MAAAVQWLRRSFLGSPGGKPPPAPSTPAYDLYLPLNIEGVKIFQEYESGMFHAVDSLNGGTPGVHFRMTNQPEMAFPYFSAFIIAPHGRYAEKSGNAISGWLVMRTCTP